MSTLHYKDSNGVIRHTSPEDRRRSERRTVEIPDWPDHVNQRRKNRRTIMQHHQNIAETVTALQYLQLSTAPNGQWANPEVYGFVTAMLAKIDR
jgi:hypothetical protein